VRTIQQTITRPGTTVEQPVTVTATPPPPTTTADEEDGDNGSAAGGSYQDGVNLTDEATGLMDEGRYEEAIGPAQQAVGILEGTYEESRPYEAYANYNLGRSLVETGDCAQGLPYLERSEQLQGQRSEITAAKSQCS
jgi:hypothetical protein